jgi:tRNA-2-methylthio-N6-dimethylallyladenosine synthase
MNVADSQRVASSLESLGYQPTPDPAKADVIVLNTCMVRQSAEEKAYGRLSSLRPLKESNPSLVINLMGCLVGVKPDPRLRARFPYVDVFSAPSDPQPLLAFLARRDGRDQTLADTRERDLRLDEDSFIPRSGQDQSVSAYLPVVLGCSHACTYCVIPYRRGVERSRSPEVILAEARGLVSRGVKEITLLGQIVDRYGKDLPAGPDLSDLIRQLHEIEGLERIRFLTSHPNWMNDRILDTVAELPKVCPHIEVPCQAGDDEVLANMKRGYTRDDYYRLVEKIRSRIPGVSIATDIIVGFPGETAEQFDHTYELLKDLKLDVAHLARYSPRPGTVATRRMVDDVPPEEKMRRFRLLEDLQEKIAEEIHARLLGQTVEVLFEGKNKNRWRGRTRTNKLVFVESDDSLRGKLLPVRITWSGPWSMQGQLDPAE